ncbi:hypothetical protein FNV43_RR10379 [Rhamnella rubrinervis]|uniref:NB-ARC domain-containing protein n=1 Tax=Rhamnella rubrinervis TaxID=2594499 RepID=A0A8K0ML31_9ROSA|nr:hypothetical protein FNV43_RR10379 [Rhamnella rubrinervis]
MITTRKDDVASHSCMEFKGKVYYLIPLSEDESWVLFCRKAFRGNACPPYLSEICKDILRKCEGLPLAVVAVSGVLATKDARRIDEWDMIRRSLGVEIQGNNKLEDLQKVLSLSFNDLPHYLKTCFLHLAIFPEGYLIKRMRLIRLWIAEGFVEVKEGKTLEEVAQDYLNELLNRNLMQVAGRTTDGRVKFFRIHDLLRGIIISKSRDQNFAAIVKAQTTTWPERVRRLSIHTTLPYLEHCRSSSHLRSLFMFGWAEKSSVSTLFPDGFRLLSVLDLQRAPLKTFPKEVADLFYLKYLSLRRTKFLERLYLTGRLEELPSWIPSLRSLARLFLKWSQLRDDPLVHLQDLPNLVHLELLQVFDGDTLCFKAGGFKKLKLLGLDMFDKLKCVQIEKGAMPSLETLVIHRSNLLWNVPFGVEHLMKLKVLEFFDMPDELIMKLCPDGKGEDHWKVKHVPEVYSAYWRDGGWDVYSIDSFGKKENSHHPPGKVTRSHGRHHPPGKVTRSHGLRTLWKV